MRCENVTLHYIHGLHELLKKITLLMPGQNKLMPGQIPGLAKPLVAHVPGLKRIL